MDSWKVEIFMAGLRLVKDGAQISAVAKATNEFVMTGLCVARMAQRKERMKTSRYAASRLKGAWILPTVNAGNSPANTSPAHYTAVDCIQRHVNQQPNADKASDFGSASTRTRLSRQRV